VGLSPSRRIAVAALSILMVGGVVVSVIVQQIVLRREEESARTKAQELVQQVLAPSVSAADLVGASDPETYSNLHSLVTTRIEGDGITSVTILSREGTVLYDDDRSLIGSKGEADRSELEPVFAGSTVSRVEDGETGGQDYQTLVPVRLRPATSVAAAVLVTNDYRAIQSASTHPWQPLQIALAAVLGTCLLLLALSSGWSDATGAISVGPKRGIRNALPGVAPVQSAPTGQVKIATAQARKAEDAYHRVFEQLRQTQEQLQDALEQHQTLRGTANEATRRAAAAERRMKSTEAALKAAREQLTERMSAHGGDGSPSNGQAASATSTAESAAGPDPQADADGSGGTETRNLARVRRQMQEAEERAAEVGGQLKAAERQVGEARAQSRLKDEEIRQLKEALSMAEKRAGASDAELARVVAATRAASAEGDDAERRRSELEGRLAAAEEARSRLERDLAERSERLHVEAAARMKAEETLASVTRRAEEAIATERQRAQDAMATEQERSQRAIEAERQRVNTSVQELRGADSAHVEKLRQALRETRTELRRVQEALERADERNIHLGERLERAEQASRLVVQMQGDSPEPVAVEVHEASATLPPDGDWEPSEQSVIIEELHSLSSTD